MKLPNTYINPDNILLLRSALSNREITGGFLPSVYVLEPTSKCNISCVMCPNNQMEPDKLGDIDIVLFERIVKDISPFAEFVMLYWMGEPLLHPQITDLLLIARSYIKGRIVISTNMTQVTDEILRALLDNCDIILCSIDRWDPTAYEKIRRGAKFETVVSNTELLLEMHSPNSLAEVVVKSLDLAQSRDEYQEFQSYWKSRGARPLSAWLNDWAGTCTGMRNAASLPIPHTTPVRNFCADLWFKMNINWRGKVQMCCFDWKYAFPVGSIGGENCLHSIWHGEKMQALRKAHCEGKFAVTDLCHTCTTWGEISEHDAYVDFNNDSYYIVF